MNNGGVTMKNMRVLLQALLCLALVFSLNTVIYGSAPVVAAVESSLAPVAVTPPEIIEVQLSLQAGWNMVSVPVTPANNSSSAVFPSVDAVFAWNATGRSYYEPTVIEPEKGYWVAVTENTIITINGTPIVNWTTDIKAGWNMIGSVNATASIADPKDYHDGSVIPDAYWWDPLGRSYNLTTDIQAGKGYWVAATEDCLLTLAASYEIVNYENTQVVPEEEVENIAEVSENRTEILFEEVTPFVASIEPGDVLACNQSVPGAEYGFLSQVTGVNNEGGVVEVQVEPATLEDAIEQGVILVTQTIPVRELMSSALWASGVEVTQVEAGYDFTYSPVEGVTIEGHVLVTADAEVYIQASFWHGLEEFWFIFSPGLEMGATLTVEESVSWDKEYTIAEIPGPPIPIWGPVTITPSIELMVGTDGEITGTLETSVAYERVYDVGVKYCRGSWSKISKMRGEGATLEPPSFTGQAEARVYAGAVLSGTAGVSYVAEAALRAKLLGNVRTSGEIATPPWRWQYDLELYLTAQVFAELDLFRIAEVSWESDVWQYPDPPYNLAYGSSGRVNKDGVGLEGVTINFSGGHSSVTTNADGYWSKHLLRGTVTATPEKSGYVFDPPSMTVTGSASNLDFQAFKEGGIEIWDWYDLDAIRDNMGGSYVLMNDLDSTTFGYDALASPTANAGKGWDPLGHAYFDGEQWVYSWFDGTFDGQGFEIRDLFINRFDENYVGLFGLGREGTIKDVGVVNAYVTGESSVGGLVGATYGTVRDSYFSGSANGDWYVGSVVGSNLGNVRNSYCNYDEVLINGENVIVIGSLFAEDFEQWFTNGKYLDVNERLSQDSGYYVINNVGDFKELLAFGQDGSLKFKLKSDLDLASELNFYIPYLAGEFDGNGHKISNLNFDFDFVSHVGLFGYLASGGKVDGLDVEDASITSDGYSGGLVGRNMGTISNCHSTGSLTSHSGAGGVVGDNWGTVTDCHSIAQVTSDWRAGALWDTTGTAL
jgi:hypothetical protein